MVTLKSVFQKNGHLFFKINGKGKTDDLPPGERRVYLLGLLRQIKIKLDTTTNEHILDIDFQFPIVGDEYLKGDSGYEVIDGDVKQVVKASFALNYRNTVVGNSKKKRVVSTKYVAN